ncbi:MAG: hypothetical protein ABII07_02640 [Patescibacteria group bacterium]|nr:hypothetical protein [Patescibacteria group bacterium]
MNSESNNTSQNEAIQAVVDQNADTEKWQDRLQAFLQDASVQELMSQARMEVRIDIPEELGNRHPKIQDAIYYRGDGRWMELDKWGLISVLDSISSAANLMERYSMENALKTFRQFFVETLFHYNNNIADRGVRIEGAKNDALNRSTLWYKRLGMFLENEAVQEALCLTGLSVTILDTEIPKVCINGHYCYREELLQEIESRLKGVNPDQDREKTYALADLCRCFSEILN